MIGFVKSLIGVMGLGVALGCQPKDASASTVDYPQIDMVSLAGQGAEFDGSVLRLTSTPFFASFDGGQSSMFIASGLFDLWSAISPSGDVSASDNGFSISGSVTDTGSGTTYEGTLFRGSVGSLSIMDVGGANGTDLVAAELIASGGLLVEDNPVRLTLALALEGSWYTGDFTESWSAARVKGSVAPVPLPASLLMFLSGMSVVGFRAVRSRGNGASVVQA